MTLPPTDPLPASLIDPALAADPGYLAAGLRAGTYAVDPQEWHPEYLRHLLANVGAGRLNPEALAATATAAARLEALLQAIARMDEAALALARQLEVIDAGA